MKTSRIVLTCASLFIAAHAASAALLYTSSTADNLTRAYDASTGAFVQNVANTGVGSFPFSVGVRYDNQNVYIGRSDRVSVYSSGGVFQFDLDGVASNVSFATGLSFDSSNNLFVMGTGNNRVVKYDSSGGFVATSANLGGSLWGGDVGADGYLYVSRFSSDDILRINPTTLAVDSTFVTAGLGGLDAPAGLRFGPDGNLYVTSNNTGQVLKYDGTTGAFISVFASSLASPQDLDFAPDGDLVVSAAGEVLRFAADGTYEGVFAGGVSEPAYGLAFSEPPITPVPEAGTAAFALAAALVGTLRRTRRAKR